MANATNWTNTDINATNYADTTINGTDYGNKFNPLILLNNATILLNSVVYNLMGQDITSTDFTNYNKLADWEDE